MAARPPSWSEIRASSQQFAVRWQGTTSEQGEAQTFWNEFLQIFGVDRRRVGLFEQHARRTSTGGRGRIDLYWPGTLVAEHKSAGKSLDEAERQALDYLDDLADENVPQVVITSDFAHIRILDLTRANPESVTVKLEDLPKEIERFGFIAGYNLNRLSGQEQQRADIRAARLMGELYASLAEDKYEEHSASVFLTRLLFLMFGDDTGMWERNLFAEFIDTRTAKDGSDMGGELAALFQMLDTPVARRSSRADEYMLRFPYVNGNLFKEVLPLPSFDHVMRDRLVLACLFDWSTISPAIFGSLFQAVKDKEARRELGEHYTTERSILKLIGPLFLDELNRRFDTCQHDAGKLRALREHLGQLHFLDPACGCGNFLVVTYRELRRLELRILKRLVDLSGGNIQTTVDVTLDLRVSLAQFAGIEIEEWPAKIAETAMFLVDQQENVELAATFGQSPDRLPITTAARIERANALRTDWRALVPVSENTVILGNPPFTGRGTRSDVQTADQKLVWGAAFNINLDYVTCWYVRAWQFYGSTPGRWGFVSTNSVSQGEPAALLWRPILEAGWRCRFAHRSFKWDSDAPGRAAVHVSIIGFDRAKREPKPRLWVYPAGGADVPAETEVTRINPYLIDGPILFVDKRTTPLHAALPKASFGSMPNDGGGLLIEPIDRATFAADPVAEKYVRPFIGAKQVLHNLPRWCLWLKDMDPADVTRSPLLQARLEKVKKHRTDSLSVTTRGRALPPQFFGQDAQPDTRYLAIPAHVSEHRDYFTAGYFGPEIICGNANFLLPDPDGYVLGVLSSSMFMHWMRAIGGRIKSDLRFSSTFVYNNFPLPELSDRQRQRLVDAAQEVLTTRAAHPNSTLAQLYNPLAMPVDLRKAHRRVDRVIDSAFGRTDTTNPDWRQAALFRSYAKLSGRETLL